MSVTGRGAKAPHSIAVELLADGERAALFCEMNGHRYHVWAILHRDNSAVFEVEDAVYKNCARGLVRGDKGYFATRTLDGTTGQGKLVRDALLAQAADLIGKARAARHAERLQQRAKREAEAKLLRVKEAGPQLLAHLMVLLDAPATAAPSDIDYSDSEKSVFEAGWRAALDMIGARQADARALLARLEA